MTHCENVHDFVFGELDDGAADSFRDHLGNCETCPEELHELLQLAALEASAADEDGELERPFDEEDDEDDEDDEDVSAPFVGDESEPAKPEETDLPIKPIEVDATPGDELALRRRRKAITVAAVVFAAAAAIGLVVWQKRSKPAPGEIVIASAKTRPLEMRLSHAGAFDHRPYDVMRAGELPVEIVPIKVMARLDERGDQLGVATAHLLGREPQKAEPLLAKLDETPDVLNDRGVTAFLRGDKREALRLVDQATKLDPGFAPALFNKALLYADLGLPLGAAKLFDQVAAQEESGWAKEALRRARELRDPAEKGVKTYRETQELGIAAIAAGEVIPLEVVKRFPGLGRLLFYDAVRGAPSKSFLEKLRPHAEFLDRHYGGDSLARAITRATKSNWTQRAPIAAVYRKVRGGGKLTKKEIESTVATAKRSSSEDIAIGLLVLAFPRFQVADSWLDEFSSLIAPIGDPWFDLLAKEQRGRSLDERGLSLEAIALLQPALETCEQERIPFRCGNLAKLLGNSWSQASRRDLGGELLQSAVGHFRSAGIEHGLSPSFAALGKLEGDRDVVDPSSMSRAIAYLDEVLLREPETCAWELYIYDLQSHWAINRRDLKEAKALFEKLAAARKECDRTLSSHEALRQAEYFAYVTPDQSLDLFLKQLDDAETHLTDPAEVIQFKLARARALAQKAPQKATALLEELAPKWNSESGSQRIFRARTFVSLAYAAADKDAFGDVLGIVARELDREAPKTCAVAILWANDRITAVRGTDGSTIGVVDRDVSAATAPIPKTLQSHLDGCEEIAVFARSPYFGSSELLAPERAWYFVSRYRPKEPSASQGETIRLVVADVAAPDALELAPLRQWSGNASVQLTGTSATRERVLDALPDADEIEFHVHGLLGLSGSDAFLVLSQDKTGSYALHSRDIESLSLLRAPTVYLGACHAGQGASTYDQPYSLATAFLEAGAETVFASQQPIADSTVGPFFQGIRDGINAGKSPAIALRDARTKWRADNSWVDNVVVFR